MFFKCLILNSFETPWHKVSKGNKRKTVSEYEYFLLSIDWLIIFFLCLNNLKKKGVKSGRLIEIQVKVVKSYLH